MELERDFQVVPVCVETMGPWGFHGLKFIQEVGKRIAAESGEPRSTTFLMQSIGKQFKEEMLPVLLELFQKANFWMRFFICNIHDRLIQICLGKI